MKLRAFIIVLIAMSMVPMFSAKSQPWRQSLDKSKVFRSHYPESKSLDSAIYYGEESRTLARAAYGDVDTSLALISLVLSEYYWMAKNYAANESLLRNSIAIYEETIGLNNVNAMNALNNLSNLVDDLGHHEAAIAIAKRLLNIRLKTFGENHADVARSYTNMAVIFLEMGHYERAEPLLRSAIKIYQNPQTSNPMGLAIAANTLGSLFSSERRFAEAESLLSRASLLFAQMIGPKSGQVGMCIENIADCYFEQGRYTDAERNFNEAITIWNAADSMSWWIPQALRRIAELHQATGRLADVESLYSRAINLHTRELPEDHSWIAEDYQSLAAFYRDQGKYDEALRYFGRTLSIYRKQLNSHHDNFASCFDDLSRLYRKRNQWMQAMEYADSAFNVRWNNFTALAGGMPEYDALNYEVLLRQAADEYLAGFLEQQSNHLWDEQRTANLVLTVKGELLQEITARNRHFFETSDSTQKMTLQSYCETIRDISKSFLRHSDDDPAMTASHELDSLEGIARTLESRLGNTGDNLFQQFVGKPISLDSINFNLAPNAILVEYLRFNYFKVASDSTMPHYLGVVLDRNRLQFINDLGSADVIDKEIERYRNHLNALMSHRESVTIQDQSAYAEIATRLYSLVWRPFADKIKKDATLFIAPDGGLNLISFAGLIDDSGKYLIERHPIHYLSAGRDILQWRGKFRSNSGLLALGDPDYNASVSDRLEVNDEVSSSARVPSDPYALRNVRSGCEVLRKMSVGSLPYTGQEVDSVARYYEQRYPREISLLYKGHRASEEYFKTSATGKRILHIATHGYYIEGGCEKNRENEPGKLALQTAAENPLLLSGLLLAGSNLHGVGADSIGAEDGVLTALEVSSMDLRGTDLVVLSACESGLGKVEQGEGVYGLRRAFQMAGVRTVVSSLWQVPDQETMKFMKELYAQKAKAYPELMQKVMLNRLRELRLRGLPTHPYSWAGFIATGDWKIR